MVLRYTSSFDETISFSDTDAQLYLTSSAPITYTLPGDNTHKYTVLFSYNAAANVFVGKGATPSIPTINTATTVANVEYRPDKRYAIGGDVLSFVTPDTAVYMGISVRSIPN